MYISTYACRKLHRSLKFNREKRNHVDIRPINNKAVITAYCMIKLMNRTIVRCSIHRVLESQIIFYERCKLIYYNYCHQY